MPRNIESTSGTVQLVLPVAVLETILDKFPNWDIFRIPTEEDDIVTYCVSPKNKNALE